MLLSCRGAFSIETSGPRKHRPRAAFEESDRGDGAGRDLSKVSLLTRHAAISCQSVVSMRDLIEV
jgi:hypothetical protein